MIARFLQVKVWELPRVAVHYQEEARAILVGQYKAAAYLEAQRFKVQGEFGMQKKFVPTVLPEF